jgi:hypothetical protein
VIFSYLEFTDLKIGLRKESPSFGCQNGIADLKVEVSLGAEQESQNINFTVPMPRINLSASARD